MTTTIPDPGGPSGTFAALERTTPAAVDTLALQLFHHRGVALRTVVIDQEPWFVAADACRMLSLRDTTSAMKMVEADDKQSLRRSDTPHLFDGMAPQVQMMTVVSESGLYSLIFLSDKAEAKDFRRWVTKDVLPAIRKTGSYSKYPAHPVASSLPSKRELAQWVIEAEDRAERAEARAAKLEPKAEFFDELMDADGCYTMQATANMIRWGRNVMMRELRRAGVLQGNNLPYRRYAHHFKVIPGTRTHPKTGELIPTATTHVLPSGVEFIRKRLANNDALAVAE